MNAGPIERSIRLKTTGHEKSKVSVCLTAKADGTKLKPFIVFPGAKKETKQLNEEFKNKCYVVSPVNGWMNEDLTRDWVRGVSGKFSFTLRMLAWDSFKCHITDSIKQELGKYDAWMAGLQLQEICMAHLDVKSSSGFLRPGKL